MKDLFRASITACHFLNEDVVVQNIKKQNDQSLAASTTNTT